MAEGFARTQGNAFFDVYSAGTHPAAKVSQNAVLAMQEKNIDISKQYPKSLDDIPEKLDVVITMGCGVECPYLLADHREDWELEDPVGMPLEKFREIRGIIEKRVKELVASAESASSKESFIKILQDRDRND